MVAKNAILLLFFSILTVAMANRYRREVVQLENNGTIEGVETKYNGRKIYEFRGIKYGKPPIGDSRFKKSEAAEIPNPLLATVFPRPCPRLEPVPREISVPLNVTDGDQSPKTVSPLEDCLYLNIFSRDLQGSNPVIVFLEGTTMRRRLFYTLRGDYLLTGAIVLVVVQFREGHLGFMTDLTEDMPGNVALWDQILALKWVKQNIKSFGGDPAKITLAGSEMGAVCAHLLSQSEEAKDLFHKLILLNGAGTVPWGIDREVAKSNELVANAAQCDADKAKCLRGRSIATLDGAYRSVLLKNPGYKLRAISPILQSDANYSGVTVKYDPLKCSPHQWGKALPTMLGFTKHAGLFVVKDEPYVTFADPDIAPVAIKRYISEYLNVSSGSSTIGEMFHKYFHPSKDGTLRYPKTGLVDFISTTGFKIPIQKVAECIASLDGTVYVFTLNYRSPMIKEGVDCGSEILYLFPSPWHQMTRADSMISSRLVTLINNFVTYGDPTNANGIPPRHRRHYPPWLTYKTNSKAYYVIADRMGTTDKMENEFTIAMADRLEKAKIDSTVSLQCNLPLIVLLILLEASLDRTCV